MTAPRRGNPGAAAGIGLLTLVLTAVLGGCAALLNTDWGGLGNCYADCGPHTGQAVALGIAAGVCLLNGLVWAWWVATRGGERSVPPKAELPGAGEGGLDG